MRTKDHVGAVAKALRVIEVFSASQEKLTLSDVAVRAGLTRAGARRYLRTLAALGYAEWDGKRFALTARVLRLGYAYLSSVPLSRRAQPVIDRVGEQAQDVAALAVLDGAEVVFVARSVQRRIVSVITAIGTRLPAFSSSTGRVLLAAQPDEAVARALERAAPIRKLTPRTKCSRTELLAEVRRARQAGYCLSKDEIEMGLRSIAVPVRNGAGTVVAALGISVHSARMGAAELPAAFLGLLVDASRELAAML